MKGARPALIGGWERSEGNEEFGLRGPTLCDIYKNIAVIARENRDELQGGNGIAKGLGERSKKAPAWKWFLSL
jgi:hypothetical protein